MQVFGINILEGAVLDSGYAFLGWFIFKKVHDKRGIITFFEKP
jgi:hypothetical protein